MLVWSVRNGKQQKIRKKTKKPRSTTEDWSRSCAPLLFSEFLAFNPPSSESRPLCSNRKSAIRIPHKPLKNHRPKIFQSQIFHDFSRRISAPCHPASHIYGFLFQHPASSLQLPEPNRDTAIRISPNYNKSRIFQISNRDKNRPLHLGFLQGYRSRLSLCLSRITSHQSRVTLFWSRQNGPFLRRKCRQQLASLAPLW